jgi:hypothetical protein
VKDVDYPFLLGIVEECGKRGECGTGDPSGVRCPNYYLCYPCEASPEIRKVQAAQIRRFRREMRKLEKCLGLVEGVLDELHKAL